MRFISEDTNKGDVKDPLSLNLYVYCVGNPIKYYDESGNEKKEVRGQEEGDSNAGGGSSLNSGNNQGGSPSGRLSLKTKIGNLWDRLFKGSAEAKLLANPKMNLHHIFPQSMKDWFAKRGIDVDKYTVELTQGVHLKGVHGKGGFVGPGDITLPGKFNDAWKTFIKNNPNATAKEVYQYAGQLMDEYGLSGLDIVPYK